MKNNQIGHIRNKMSKSHGIFTENIIIFFKCRENWKRAGILILQTLEYRPLEMM